MPHTHKILINTNVASSLTACSLVCTHACCHPPIGQKVPPVFRSPAAGASNVPPGGRVPSTKAPFNPRSHREKSSLEQAPPTDLLLLDKHSGLADIELHMEEGEGDLLDMSSQAVTPSGGSTLHRI